MSLTATGVGSGLDVEGLVTKLMEAERLPLEQRLVRREMAVTEDISALGSLKSALTDLRSSLAAGNSRSTYSQRNASSSDSASVGVVATPEAVEGSYTVSVGNLAASQSLAVRAEFSSITEVVGTGTLSFTFGATGYSPDTGTPPNNANDSYDSFTAKAGVASQSIVIDSSNNTLAGIRDAVNSADIGVSAAVVNTGSGFRLLLSSESGGAENGFKLEVSDTGDANDTDSNGLSRLAFNGAVGTANAYLTAEAKDASYTINGLSLTSSSNTVTNAVTGLTLTLKQSGSATHVVSVTNNKEGIKSALKAFVDGYNKFTTIFDELTGYDAASGVGGGLQGDFTARSISNQLRSSLNSAAEGYFGQISRLADIGVTTQPSGSLLIDDAILNSKFESDFDSIARVLSRFAETSAGSGLSVNSLSDAVSVGSYAVEISSLATSGSLSATIMSGVFPITVGSSTDEFVVTVDGTASGTVALTNQAYSSLSTLATEIQTKINADATLREAEKSVSVSVSGDQLEIRSTSVGSSSSVALLESDSDTTLASLGLASATAVVGTDLVGTINGVAGVAAGNTLSGAASNGLSGLSIDVTSVAGGIVTVSNGVLDQIDSLLEGLLGTENNIDSRIASLNARAESIGNDRLVMERRLEAIELSYRRQFNSLDALLSRLQSTGSFVVDQLANIPIPGKTKK